MTLVDICHESGLSHVSDTMVWKALKQTGIRSYREESEFILKAQKQASKGELLSGKGKLYKGGVGQLWLYG